MTRFEDPVRVVVPHVLAGKLVAACTADMDGHLWDAGNVERARRVLAGGEGRAVVARLSRSVARGGAPGWAVLALPARLGDEELERAAAGVLAAIGRPFLSVPGGRGLWIGGESSADKDPGSFGGTGLNRLHVDAPNVERVPDYTALLVLRPDPAGGGASLVGDLRAAAREISEADARELRRPVYFEGRVEGLLGVGAPRMPFPVLDDTGEDPSWIRWAAKMLDDPRNAGDAGALTRFDAALARHTRAVALGRGQLLVCDQRRAAHGRAPLGDQSGLPEGGRRMLMQAKAAFDALAPAQATAVEGSDG